MKLSKINAGSVFMVTLVVLLAISPEFAMAAQDNIQKTNVAALVTSPLFKGAVDLGLLVFAGWQWFNYIANFTPETAFKAVLVPAAITFFAFQWTDLLGWVGVL